MNAELAQLLVSRDPVAAVTIEDIYELAHAEVGRRLSEVFSGDTAPADDEAFHMQSYLVGVWTWYVVADTSLAHIRNNLGVTNPATWLAVETAVKTFAVEALTTLRRVVESDVRSGDPTPPPDGDPEVRAVMERFRQRLDEALGRKLHLRMQPLSRELLARLIRNPDETGQEETP